MSDIDRNFVLTVLSEKQSAQDADAFNFNDSNPTLSRIARERSFSLGLLITAVEDGMLEQLRATALSQDWAAEDGIR